MKSTRKIPKFWPALIVWFMVVVIPATAPAWADGNSTNGGQDMTLTLTSPAFEDQGEIPERYTCDGKDISPELRWRGVPENAKSLVLIVDDPDAPDPAAPKMTWIHWLLYNLPADSQGLPQAVKDSELPAGTLPGENSWHRTGYGGPCPPIGRHRYFFKLYALDTVLPDLKTPEKDELLRAMQGHIVAETRLMGTYQR